LKLEKIEKPTVRGKKIRGDKRIGIKKKCGNKSDVIIMARFNEEIRSGI